jgi:acyl carrier protein
MERTLVGLWAETLAVGSAGIDDDFFALGGDSLRASRLAVAVRDRLAVDLTLRDLFLARTPAALAERLRSTSAAGRTLPPVRRRR